jgi:subtilisin-like proprotein convertase family protein
MRFIQLAASSILFSALSVPAAARSGPPARSSSRQLQPLARVQDLLLPAVDTFALLDEDEKQAEFPAPSRFATPLEVDIDIERDGTWDYLPGGDRIWRLLIESPGAQNLNLAFSTYLLPFGAALYLYNPETGYSEGPFTSADNKIHGEFWSPVVLGDLLVVELDVPAKIEFEPELAIMRVHHGYRPFAPQKSPDIDQGSCNVDVICPEGDPWRQEIRSAAVYTLNGYWTCSGQMINSIDGQRHNYFLTANHCGIGTGNDHSIVVYWNFESPVCGMLSGGSLADNQSGSTWRAGNAFSDFTLIELDDTPEPSWSVSYSGWDATGNTPASCVAIHHPSTDEKAISFNDDPLLSESYLGDYPNDHSHWRIDQWEVGTTEPGSSGSGIWDPTHHLVGQLHGGYASCTSLTSDWYGKFAESWDHGSSASTRLKDWLDPNNTGILILDTEDPDPPLPTLLLSQMGSQDYCGSESNGTWEPGENILVGAELQAINSDITGIGGRLVALTEGVTVLTSKATWPDIPANEKRSTEAPYFEIKLAPELVCGTVAEFRLDLQFDQGTTFVRFSETLGGDGPELATVEAADLPKTIPDNNQSGVTSALSFTPTGTVDRVIIGTVIEHTWVGDLELEVTSPGGTTVTLLSEPGNGSCSDNNMEVLFSDDASVALNGYCGGHTPWFKGRGRPLEPLSSFHGQPAAGTWTLRVIDHAGQDTGRIMRWGLRVFDVEGRICDVCTE